MNPGSPFVTTLNIIILLIDTMQEITCTHQSLHMGTNAMSADMIHTTTIDTLAVVRDSRYFKRLVIVMYRSNDIIISVHILAVTLRTSIDVNILHIMFSWNLTNLLLLMMLNGMTMRPTTRSAAARLTTNRLGMCLFNFLNSTTERMTMTLPNIVSKDMKLLIIMMITISGVLRSTVVVRLTFSIVVKKLLVSLTPLLNGENMV